MATNMYASAKTWNPFRGCNFGCTYCEPSFGRQARRQKHLCNQCYSFAPHCHPERLGKIPSAEIVFVAGVGDISFCPPDFVHQILDAIEAHNRRCPHKTYYLQSKKPECMVPFLKRLPPNVILVTTLETNRDAGYSKISKAPPPSVRYRQFRDLDYHRKVVTVEPVLDFDLDTFSRWLLDIAPEYIWLGFNSHPKAVHLPEPNPKKLLRLEGMLLERGVLVKRKSMRGLATSGGQR